MNRFKELLRGWHTGERHAIEDLLLCSAEYVRAETVTKVLAMNIPGRDEAEQNEKMRSANRGRITSLDGLVYAVHIVNRICAKRGKPPIYRGKIDHQGCVELAVQLGAETIDAQKE